jgi:pimeloyl-ACP methyl ester carboxylesterase
LPPPGGLPHELIRVPAYSLAALVDCQRMELLGCATDAEPAGVLIGAQREFCRAWPNQQTVLVKGSHFLQEEAPDEVGEATAKFVSRVLAGQIS